MTTNNKTRRAAKPEMKATSILVAAGIMVSPVASGAAWAQNATESVQSPAITHVVDATQWNSAGSILPSESVVSLNR